LALPVAVSREARRRRFSFRASISPARGDRLASRLVSLRLQINLLIAAMIAAFVVVVFAFELIGTRSSVREEVQAGNVVAAQLMSNFDWNQLATDSDTDHGDKRLALVNYLARLGRVRANEITLLDDTGRAIYQSPPSPYKSGRDAPAWYAALVQPDPIREEFALPGGKLVIESNASRAVLDGWDDAVRLFEFGIAIIVIGNLLAFWLVGVATRPFRRIVHGLQAMQSGAYDTRLPTFAGAEADAISGAFNRMAQSIQDNLSARQDALEANVRLDQSRELALLVQNRIEDERRHIARELHDETGQSVTAIRSLAQSLVHRFGDGDTKARETAQLISDTAAHLYGSMHNLIPRLRPLALDDLSLAEALDEQIAQWRQQHAGIEFSLASAGLPSTLGESYLLASCRIVQEAVVNALRHGEPKHVRIAAHADAKTLTLDVVDDGRGLADDWQAPGHFGIRGMRERARTLGGDVAVIARATGGVHVKATLPLK
jgi:two-component system sensor histidine kinase UhpB